MKSEQLKERGAIYFENIVDGMKQYENHVLRMDGGQACAMFLKSTWWGNYEEEYIVFTER